ncbi:BPSL0761 family protein [Pseudomonas fildesensis]|uniref:BPSL0761 family protein n=1 Tax=Pseudomonas fildesensis TaxID=1674920 RepID=UPI0009E44868|nr:BPSL0761 family protein [Pseudomonas fildesensis]
MTTPSERSRAVIQTHEFLNELSRDDSLPEKVRHDAKFLLRHFPGRAEVVLAGRLEEEAVTLPIPFIFPVFSSSIEE